MSSTGSDPECDFLGFGWVRSPSAFRTAAEEALALAEAAETTTAQMDTSETATVSPAAEEEAMVVASPEVVRHYLAVARNAFAAATLSVSHK